MYARPFIDSLDFARNGRQIDGEVPVADLPRLRELLADTQGTLSYAVRGGSDQHGNPVLHVSVGGTCRLVCQRCLNGMEYPLRIDTQLVLRDQRSLDELDDEEEERDSILAEAHLDVLNLLEEEILLSLPIAPRHELGGCPAADGGDATRTNEPRKEGRHPFAVLAKLKRS